MAASNYPTSSAAHAGVERLWKIWWLWGIAVGWATSGMIVFAEFIRAAGYWGAGDLVDVIRLLVYFSWARLAWRCSHNVQNRRWTSVSRFALGGRVRLDGDVLASAIVRGGAIHKKRQGRPCLFD